MAFPIYCELPFNNVIFEPLNTITNLFFIFAGIILWNELKSQNKLDNKGMYFSILIITIGVGSLAWHLYRHSSTLLFDSIPIGIFVLTYLFFYLRKIVKKISTLILLYFGFFVYSFLISFLITKYISGLEGAGTFYFVAISYFFVLQIYNWANKIPIIRSSVIATMVFMLSLLLRQIDLLICSKITIGTHFLWHTLNALTLYLLVKILYKKI
jgi:hypothetical protein